MTTKRLEMASNPRIKQPATRASLRKGRGYDIRHTKPLLRMNLAKKVPLGQGISLRYSKPRQNGALTKLLTRLRRIRSPRKCPEPGSFADTAVSNQRGSFPELVTVLVRKSVTRKKVRKFASW